MKTRKLTILTMVIWGFVLVVSTVIFLSLFVSGGGNKMRFNNSMFKSTNRSEYIVVASGSYNGIKSINLEWVNGNVNFFKNDGTDIKIIQKASSEIPEKQLYNASVSGEKLTINDARIKNNGKFIFNFGRQFYSSDIEIYLPKEIYDSININAVSADVDIEEILTKEIYINSVSGYIAGDIISNYINLDTVSGDMSIHFGTPADNDIDVRTATVSGKMEMNFDSMPKRIDTDAVSGDVKLSLPENNFTVNLDTISGDIRLENISNSKGNEKFIVAGKGDCAINAGSVSGDISISVR